MSLVNAVRVVDPEGGAIWVTDPTSIAAYGRREEELRVSDVLGTANTQRIGAAYLASRKNPQTSVQVQPGAGPVPGVDYDVGDLVTVNGSKQRCVDIAWTLDADTGEWEPPTPTFSSRANERAIRADRAFDRLISLQGGGGVDATALSTFSLLPMEALKPSRSLSWSHYDSAASGSRTGLNDNTKWQEVRIEEPCRAGMISCVVDYAGATGQTTIELHRNGSLWDGLFNVVIPSAPPFGVTFIFVRMYGYEVLNPGDLMTIKVIENGQHRQFGYELHLFPRI